MFILYLFCTPKGRINDAALRTFRRLRCSDRPEPVRVIGLSVHPIVPSPYNFTRFQRTVSTDTTPTPQSAPCHTTAFFEAERFFGFQLSERCPHQGLAKRSGMVLPATYLPSISFSRLRQNNRCYASTGFLERPPIPDAKPQQSSSRETNRHSRAGS